MKLVIVSTTLSETEEVLSDLKRRFPNEPEYHQAVAEVLGTIEEARHHQQDIEVHGPGGQAGHPGGGHPWQQEPDRPRDRAGKLKGR